MKTTSARLLTGLMLAGLAGALVSGAGCGSSSSTPTDAGSGGSAGSGGKGGSAGGGVGGAGGGGGTTLSHKVDHEFATGLEMFALNDYADPNHVNLAGKYATDGGTDAAATDGGAAAGPKLEFDSAVGSPSPGSMKITVTYTNYDQYVDVVINPSPLLDLSGGRTLHAMVMLDSGAVGSTFGVQLHASTGANFGSYGMSTFTSLTAGTWTPLTVDLSQVTSAGWDASMVAQIGVQFSTGTAAATAFPGPVTAVLHVDTITD